MNKKIVRIVSIIIAALMILGLLASVAPMFVSASQAEINKQQQKKNEAQQKLDSTRTKRAKTLQNMELLEKEAGDIQSKIDAVNAKIAETDKSLAEQQVKLDAATKKAEAQYALFKERFRVMCEQGDVSYIEMLLSAQNFGDFVDKVEIVKEISQHDKAIFDKMEANRLEIEAARDEIAALKETQEASKNDLSSQKAALVKKQQEQQAYMKELENDAATYQKIIDQADAAMESLRRSISGSLSSSSRGKAYVGGEFTWPTPSCHYITSHFSPRRKNPVSGIYKRHTGTDIGAAYGTTIVAANSGTVTLAGWNSGYGNCVVIDHGGGKATLYAHMSSYSVSRGQSVQKGQQIGRVGSTGNSTGPHLHFEVLINGAAVDPMQFFN